MIEVKVEKAHGCASIFETAYDGDVLTRYDHIGSIIFDAVEIRESSVFLTRKGAVSGILDTNRCRVDGI